SALSQLAVGARGRLDPERAPTGPAVAGGSMRPLTVAVTRVLSGADATLSEHAVASSLDELLADVPRAIAHLVLATVWRMAELPLDAKPAATPPSEGGMKASQGGVRVSDALPTWMPAGRTIGGFYVLRALSAGAVGSVFVATRVEDRSDPNAEKLALKVPEY